MEISSFSRMKSFRKSGRLFVILKLNLPELRADSDDEGFGSAEVFNSFYLSLAEAYQGAAGKMQIDESTSGQRPTTVNVGFEEITDEYLSCDHKLFKKCCEPVVIKRFVRINRNGHITTKENIDVFDLKLGVFIK